MSQDYRETVQKRVFRFLLVAAIYFVSDRVGTLMANPQTHVSAVWPASGACILALYLFGIRSWPAVFGSSLVACAWTPGLGWETIPFSVCNVLEAILGALVLHDFERRFPRKHNIRWVLAVLVTTVVAPGVGIVWAAISLKFFSGPSGPALWPTLLSWWTGDLIGVLAVLSTAMALHHALKSEHRKELRTKLLFRLPLILCAAAAVGVFVFWSPWGDVSLFMLFPMLLVATVLMGAVGATTAAFVLVGLGAWSSTIGHGPFGNGSLDQNLWQLDLFAVSVPLAAMLLSVLRDEGSLRWPGSVLLTGWALSGWLFASLTSQRVALDDGQFKRLQGAVVKDLQSRMATYTEALIGSASFLSMTGLDNLDGEHWKAWLGSQRVLERLSGIRGICTVQIVPDNEMPSFLRQAQARFFKGFTVKKFPVNEPSGPLAFHYIVTLVNPERDKAVVGFDLASEKNRSATAQAAISSGDPTMTGRVVFELKGKYLTGFSVFVPVYRPHAAIQTPKERLNAAVGFIAAPFFADAFFQGVLDRMGRPMDIDVFEGVSTRPEDWIYGPGAQPRKHFFSTSQVTIAGRLLTIGWNRGPGFVPQQSAAAAWASACSALLTLLLACLVASLQSISARANSIAAERTAALKASRDHLAKALVAADAANDAKSEFLAVMSHEIRTPMNGVLGMNTLLRQTKLSAEQNEYVQAIQLSGEGLLTLINDILDFSRIEAGQLTLEAQPFSLRRCIGENITLLAPRASAKGIELTQTFDPGVPEFVIGDVGRLRQVLLNLIGNAVKFTHVGSVCVHVNCLEKTDTHCQVSVSVQDTGIGIPQQAQGKLFERFSQVDATTTRRYGGTGLGLAISKNLIRLMDGQLGFESKEGQGSTFTFDVRLPICPSPPAGLSESVPLGQSRVLVVDDDVAEANEIAHCLQRVGVRHQSVQTREDAISSLREAWLADDAYDAVFVPDSMPDSLLALRQAIARDPARRQAALILIRKQPPDPSSKAVPDLSDMDLSDPNTIEAPLDAAKIFETLARVLNREQTAGIPAPQRLLRAEPSRLLIVEDNLINQKVLKKLMESLGYLVDVASNGREAVQSWRSETYAAILMDCQMPEMDGYEATRAIREAESGKTHIPIIAVTANAMVGDHENCLAAGMDAFISKPIKTEVLTKVLEDALLVRSE
jgi:signal transduction histidine kinase/DNA-binding response OmpR family regulator/integral membrane sensor domain MASE1